MDLESKDDEALDIDEVHLLCRDLNVYDDNLTKRGIIRPFAMSRDLNEESDEVSLRWVSFLEFTVRLACIKFGDNHLAVLAGRMHKEDRNLDDDDGESGSIDQCMDRLMRQWFGAKQPLMDY